MSVSATMTVTELYSTMFRQVNRFNSVPQQINKVLITDDSEWRTRAGTQGKLAQTDTYIGVMVPYTDYQPLVTHMENAEHKSVVFSEICATASKLGNQSLYKLISMLREIAVYDFDKTAASYEYETVGADNDVALTARVPGERGGTLYSELTDGGAVSVAVSDNSGGGTDNQTDLGYDAGVTKASTFVAAINAGVTKNVVVATYEGTGAGVMTCAETASGVTSLAFHEGATTSGVAGTTVGRTYASARAAASSTTAGITLTSIYSGSRANTYTLDVRNQGSTSAMSVVWASSTGSLVIYPKTAAGDIAETASSVIASASFDFDTSGIPFTCTTYGTGTCNMVTSTSVSFTGGYSDVSNKYTAWKSIYVYRTKNSDPEFVIIGAAQAKDLGFI